LSSGEVAALTVAGGQGTRLGVNAPKGVVRITPIQQKTLFELFAEMVQVARRRYDASIPWLIMTSPENDRVTKAFFEQVFFGDLHRLGRDLIFFQQEMLPTFDFQGRMLTKDGHSLALAPNGHGGVLKALVTTGALKELQERGIKYISYFQIDNPLVKPFDPLFLGLHAMTDSEMSTKVALKTEPYERVGNLCSVDDVLTVIEYFNFNVLTDLVGARNEDSSLRFHLGNLGIHILSTDFIERIGSHGFQIPFHRAEKAVQWRDLNGFTRTPRAPNGVKLETFIFDALPLAKNPLLLMVDRKEEFAPVKSLTGQDTREAAIDAQIARASRWLEAAGIVVPKKPGGDPDAIIELAPAYALDAEDVEKQVRDSFAIGRGESVYAGPPPSRRRGIAQDVELDEMAEDLPAGDRAVAAPPA
jgi:UDP-N-acetylglucosamine/UDP-N-acetylgalactosamine diphosphorylase